MIWVRSEVQGRVIKIEFWYKVGCVSTPISTVQGTFWSREMVKSHITLKTYTGQKVTPEGELKCNVKFRPREGAIPTGG